LLAERGQLLFLGLDGGLPVVLGTHLGLLELAGGELLGVQLHA
jgi:hypothetical protein